jgi:hypothetical protein
MREDEMNQATARDLALTTRSRIASKLNEARTARKNLDTVTAARLREIKNSLWGMQAALRLIYKMYPELKPNRGKQLNLFR